ncbi:MAG: hypothetical protein HY978_04705 [Candidatus Liptonbacteria bacterium]|nr:hypothetical protein [Candidatus Liptonbacteria bacterium]
MDILKRAVLFLRVFVIRRKVDRLRWVAADRSRRDPLFGEGRRLYKTAAEGSRRPLTPHHGAAGGPMIRD